MTNLAPPAFRDPLYFRLARNLPVKKWFARSVLNGMGLLRDAAPVPFYDRTAYVPMSEGESWEFTNIGNSTNSRRASTLAALLNESGEAFDLLDCGANWGAFSLTMALQCPTLRRIVSVEPNAAYASVLRRNLASFNAPSEVYEVAVSDFTGRGRLVVPDYDSSPHAWYIVPDSEGDIDVVRLDDLYPHRGGNIVLKLDIEGEELAALQSAQTLLRAASRYTIFIEFHKSVLQRKNLTQADVFDYVETLKPTRWFDAERVSVEIDKTRPLFEQVKNDKQCDLIGISI